MYIFVTGATGFLGASLVRRLVAEGHQVTASVRDLEKASRLFADLSKKIDFVRTSDDDGARRALQQADGIVNLAGEPVAGRRWTDAYRRQMIDSRVATTTHLVSLLADSQVEPAARRASRVLVSASAIGIYGDAGDAVLTERSRKGSGFLADLCEMWERAAGGALAHGWRVVTPRVGVVFGRGGGMLGELMPIFKAGLGGSAGSGRQYLSWIHLRDLENIVLRCLGDESLAGALNATSPSPLPYAEFAHAFGKALHRPSVVNVPALALRMRFGEGANVILASQRVVPERLSEAHFQFGFAEIGAALANVVNA